MKSVLITIGDEILIGQVTDTNAAWIAGKLTGAGISVEEMITVPDDPGRIFHVLDRCMGRYDLLVMTGGLGPTDDDITKQTLAEYFQSNLVTNQQVLEKIKTFFLERGRTLIDSNIRQADVPENCRILMNDHGTAPGMWFERKGSILVSLPGVPYEMKGLMEDRVLPQLRELIGNPKIAHRTIMTQGVPESYLAAMLRNWESELPGCVKLAYLPRPGIVRLRISAIGSCADDSERILQSQIDKLLKIIPQHVFGYDDESLEAALGGVLKEKRLTIATAESCTGGNVARLIASVPGSSEYYLGSVVSYQDEIKTSLLGVDRAAIGVHGAVSREVVEQMAGGAARVFGADTSLAISGIAGPGGGSEEKPVGTTWIAVHYGTRTHSRKFRFGGTRNRIVTQASYTAMQLLRRMILDTLLDD